MVPKPKDVSASAAMVAVVADQVAESDRGGKKAIHVPPARHDTLELSDLAKLMAKARKLPEVRQELIARVRSEIAAGTCDQAGKLSTALDRLLNELT